MTGERSERSVLGDFLLCNRCGACRAVCPVAGVVGEEWASARGKVELAEAFFRGEQLGDDDLRAAFDLCLHCMTCEENCPSGMRAEEVVLAARTEMARRGMIPRAKRIALRMLEGMDNALFRAMRLLGMSRKGPPHGIGGKSPLSVFFPLFGWPRGRFVPLPRRQPFLRKGYEFFPASFFDRHLADPARFTGREYGDESFGDLAAASLIDRVLRARLVNRAARRSVYFFVGHTVNHFFPEEAEATVLVLNLLGINVHAPADQACCGAPALYAGDLDAARRAARKAVEKIALHETDWIVTTCASGGRMLRHEFPRLFDIGGDGFFEIEWDPGKEAFARKSGGHAAHDEYYETGQLYRSRVEGKVFDINELVAGQLGLERVVLGFDGLASGAAPQRAETRPSREQDPRPVVTYHHPCHLKRGQQVDWQPEMILEGLPGWRYERMRGADVCCGGGGSFTFMHPGESEAIAGSKIAAIDEVSPGVVATACPLCRIQLKDMLGRMPGGEGKKLPPRDIPVVSPVELLAGDLLRIIRR